MEIDPASTASHLLSRHRLGWITFQWGKENSLRNPSGPLTASDSCIFAGISIEISVVLMTSVKGILTQPVIKNTKTGRPVAE